MSIETKILVLKCDKCGKGEIFACAPANAFVLDSDPGAVNAVFQIVDFHKEGWTHDNKGKDYCDGCSRSKDRDRS